MDTPFWTLVKRRAAALLGVPEPEGQDIAALTGQSPAAVSLWKKGQTPNPRVDTILEIADGLNLDPDEVWQAVKESTLQTEEPPKEAPARKKKLSDLQPRRGIGRL
jgi:transcriptional regulator with XRE-family HTH domain